MCKRLIPLFVMCMLLLSVVSIAQVQQSNLSATRPGSSPFPSKLSKGVLVLESGLLVLRTRLENESRKDISTRVPVQIRYGLLENLELNMTMAYASFNAGGNNLDDEYRGLGETSLGAKIKIADEKGNFPRIEFHGSLELPYIGDDRFVPDDVEPEFNVNFLHNLNDRFQLTYGVGMFWRGPDENGLYGMKATRFIGPNQGLYVEHYGLLRGNDQNEFHAAFGYLILVKSKLQFDIGFDIGKMNEANFIGLTAGMAFLAKG